MGAEKANEVHPGILARLKEFFRFGRRLDLHSSRFYEFIKDLDHRDPEYHAAHRAVVLCEEAIGIVSARVQFVKQTKEAEKALTDYKCYEDLSDDSAKLLKAMVHRLKGLNRDRYEIKNQMLAFDPGLEKLAELEDDARSAVGEIKDAEHRQRLFKQDMNYLRGEKSDLQYQRSTLIKYELFTRRFMTVVLVFFVVCATVMTFSAVAYGAQILVPISVMTVLVIIVTSLLYWFRQRVKRELEMNKKKQKKAVGLLNTKSAVFAHYSNYLDFTYRKYRVRNAEMLRRHLKEFDHYRHLARRYDALRKQSDAMERELADLLFLLKIPIGSTPMEDFVRFFNLEEQRDVYRHASGKLKTASSNTAMLDERQAHIWDQLTALNRYEGSLVDRIVSRYVEEASRVVTTAESVLSIYTKEL